MQVNVTLAGGAAALTLLISFGVWYDQHLKNSTENHINDLKNQIDSYEKSSSWKLPETLKQLSSVSAKLEKQIQAQADLEKLKLENEKLEKINKELTKKLDTATEESGTLRTQISTLSDQLRETLITPQELALSNGTSAYLVKNKIALGVETIYPTWVTGYINNDYISLNIGNLKSINVMNNTCTLRLTKIVPPSAYFSYTCR
ncbi:hypothetical protein AL532_25990 [Pseudomonas monteilii]|uniref:Uncharacterized protein n=1 Tax=Pseudomonas kurunegalensis TaxID=485880 RepID=A0ACC5UVD4_9PSED|nr:MULTISPECIES: hypothetical protein [Pseudomonas]AVH39522.1 hypothetical protein AL532_25990 [Pseudomonas monteilii]MBV4518403.1 hypothetical protein [Pseudomonas kurunegalensis]